MAEHIVVMGMMAAGKTTVGEAVAARLGVPYADNDAALLGETGSTAAAFLAHRGVDALHRIEHDILQAAVQRDDGAVVAAPGSVALDPRAADVLRGQLAVWLRARLETLLLRLRSGPARPLIGEGLAAHVQALMLEREPGFARLATFVIDVDDQSVDALAQRIVDRWHEFSERA